MKVCFVYNKGSVVYILADTVHFAGDSEAGSARVGFSSAVTSFAARQIRAPSRHEVILGRGVTIQMYESWAWRRGRFLPYPRCRQALRRRVARNGIEYTNLITSRRVRDGNEGTDDIYVSNGVT